MSLGDIKGTNLLRWEVKPVWKIWYPSQKVGLAEGAALLSFDIFGVDRGALDINRNWEKINSVEQFNQGFAAKPTDFTFTIVVKERSDEFEKFRRLSKAAIYFDVTCNILRREAASGGEVTHGDNQHGFGNIPVDFIQWLDGFEKYIGCLVNREGQTVEIGTVPLREFEIVFLEHAIMTPDSGNFNTADLVEGDGSFPTIEDLNI